MADLNEAARGHWPSILGALAGLNAQQLTDRHQPCPLCGGEDRYRFDDKDGTGSWFCNQCGGKDQRGGAGNGMDLLMRRNRWTYAEAAKRVEQHLGLPPSLPPTSPPTRGAETVWRYSDTFLVCRFPGKKIRPLWHNGTEWKWQAPPAPRPLLNLDKLKANPTAGVLVVEGEKAADAAARLFPKSVITTWPSGCKAVGKADWTPLAGRRVTLWPDADAVGQQAMDRIGQLLLRLGVQAVRMITPPPGVPEGWDVADAEWTPQEAAAYVRDNISEPLELDPEPELPAAPESPDPTPDADEPDHPAPIDPAKGDHFQCLGFDGDAFYYQPKATGQVVKLTAAGHSGTGLLRLAPLSYWETIYPGGRGAVNWNSAVSSLFDQQAAVGVYAPDRIRGRGAYLDRDQLKQERIVLHLGDRLVIDGKERNVLAGTGFKSGYIYQNAQQLTGPNGATPLSDAEALVIADLASRFHWEVPASGLLLAGWVTLAPVCGALDWRPHAWLTGSAGSGKSAILDRYVRILLGDMGIHVLGNTTEAGLRQTLRSDALPVVFDEFESNEKGDQARVQGVLTLARVASSESNAKMLKGTPSGEVLRFHVRSMFFMSSIATALKQGADRSRFAQLTMRNTSDMDPAEKAAHWEALDRDLSQFITPEVAQRLIARTIRLIPTIRASAKVFRRVAAERFNSARLGDQYGTLLAGAWSLMSSEVATPEQALTLIEGERWESYQEATAVPDEVRCLQTILQHQIRVEADGRTLTRTLGELVEIAALRDSSLEISPSQAEAHLGRHGLRVDRDARAILVSNTAQTLAHILRETAWSHCWSTLLSRLPGATRGGVIHFKGLGASSRCVSIPLDTAA